LNRPSAFAAALYLSSVTASWLAAPSAPQTLSEEPSKRSQLYAIPEDNAETIG
jgi:hypothetical protein